MDLLDNYVVSGVDLETFRNEAVEFDNATTIEPVETDCLTVLHCYKQVMSPGQILSWCHVLYEDCIGTDDSGNVNLETQLLKSAPSKFIRSLKNNCLLNFDMDYIDMSKSYFLSDFAVKTLAKSIGVKSCYLKSGYTKSLTIANGIPTINDLNVVVRRKDGFQKIFAFIGGRYKRIQLQDVADIADLLKEQKTLKLKNYKISHEMSEVNFKYLDDFEVSLQTSDTCKVSDAIRVYYIQNNEKFFIKEYDLGAASDIESFMSELGQLSDRFMSELTTKKIVAYARNTINKALGCKLGSLLTDRDDFEEILFNIHNLVDLSDNQTKEYRKMFVNAV